VSATSAPARAAAIAIARPMPLDPPVTSIRIPANDCVGGSVANVTSPSVGARGKCLAEAFFAILCA